MERIACSECAVLQLTGIDVLRAFTLASLKSLCPLPQEGTTLEELLASPQTVQLKELLASHLLDTSSFDSSTCHVAARQNDHLRKVRVERAFSHPLPTDGSPPLSADQCLNSQAEGRVFSILLVLLGSEPSRRCLPSNVTRTRRIRADPRAGLAVKW